MTTQAQATGASVPVQIGEKTFMASMLSDRQWGELTLWLQARQLRIAKAAIDPELNEPDHDREESRVMSLISRLDARMSMRDIASVPDGFSYWTWQLLRKSHPAITNDEVHQMIEASPGDTKNVYEAWKLLNAVGETRPPAAAKQA